MPLDTKIHVGLAADLATALDMATSRSQIDKQWQINMATGVGADQADVLWHDERTLAASANEDLDLAGSLAGLLGGTVTFVKIKGLIVYALPANANDVVIGGAATNTFVGPFGAATHTIKVPPGGLHMSLAPKAAGLGTVTPATGDQLRVANGGGGTEVKYQIFVVGTSA